MISRYLFVILAGPFLCLSGPGCRRNSGDSINGGDSGGIRAKTPRENEEPEPLSLQKMDILMEALEGRAKVLRRGNSNGEADGCRRLVLIFRSAMRWINPQLNETFEGEIFRQLFSCPERDAPALSRAWLATLKELECNLDGREKELLRNITGKYVKLRELSSRELYRLCDGTTKLMKSARKTLKKEELRLFLRDPEVRRLISEEYDLYDIEDEQMTELFHEFVRDMKEALDREDFLKLAAFFKSLHLRVRC